MSRSSVCAWSRRSRATGRRLLTAILLLGLFLPTPLLTGSVGLPAPAAVPPQPAWVQTGQAYPSTAGPAAPTTSDPQPPPSSLYPPTAGSLTSAYIRDIELDDGRRQVIVSTSPINYQADDGSWQPIDPRFEVIDGGFMNRSNSLVISAGERKAAVRLRKGQDMIVWEPLALLLATAGGEETVLARPLDDAQASAGTLDADGTTIQYAGSWSLAGLTDRVTAGPGQVEESLILAERPAGEGEHLLLQATLYLLPGAQLYADGAIQPAGFTTAGPIEVRDAQGRTVVVLAPPLAFEQDRPGAAVAGRYRLEPRGAGQWQVAVETPWSWWADPERVYPVVLDPTMYELKALELADIYSAWPNACSDPPVPPQAGEYAGPTVGVGASPDCGILRTLLRFHNLPTLPPGYQIEEARLDATPVRGHYLVINPPGHGPLYFPAIVNVSLYRILDGQSWDGSTVNWGNQPAIDPNPLPGYTGLSATCMVLSPEGAQKQGSGPVHLGGSWTLQSGPTGMVSDWLAGNNHGLELRTSTEEPCQMTSWGTQDCKFLAFPVENLWTEDDRRDGVYMSSQGGGFALEITYAAPTLQNEVPLIYTDPLLLPTAGDDYLATFHSYATPATSSWMAVGVKGLKQFVQGTVTYYDPAGNLGIGWLTGKPSQRLSTGDYAGRPNYLVIPTAYAHGPVEIQPPAPSDPANADLDTYMVEASIATAFTNTTLLPNTVFTRTIRMSSTHMLKTFSLNLAANTRVAVKVSGFDATALAFPPQVIPSWVPKEMGISMDPFYEVQVNQGGTWGLVVEYPGPVTSPEWSSPDPVTVEITVRVQACDMNAVPTDNGCEIVNCPVASNCHDVGPYHICSDAGFVSGPAPGEWTSRMVAPNGTPYATCIGTAGSTDRWVAVNAGPVHFFEQAPLSLDGYAIVSLARFDGENPTDLLPLWQRVAFGGYPNAGPDYGKLRPNDAPSNYVRLPLDSLDAAQAHMFVDVLNQYAQGDATLARPVETSPGSTETFQLALQWIVTAEGYGSGPWYTVTPNSGPGQADISSLTLLFDDYWAMDFNVFLNRPNGKFTTLRNWGQIVQPSGLGGAYKDVQAVILPYGKGLPGASGEESCLGYCLEPRAVGDSLSHPNRTWQMPDIEVNGQARTMSFSSPGQFVVYSSDHPDALDDVGVPFSYRFLEGDVSVSKEYCPGDTTTKVTVIHGRTKIVIPGIGSGTEPPMIDADFILCETSLRQVILSIDASTIGVGIPVGTTGVFIDGVGGTILVAPDHTVVTLGIHYKAGPTADILNSNTCDVTVDTAGLFDMQTSGTVLHAIGYGGHVWVAWNPLDVGVDVGVGLDFSIARISGQVHAHAWQGRGWQSKYWWLPDDKAMHLAGELAADITLVKGGMISVWWLPDIPPCDLTLFSLDLAFGQFCGEGCGCACYEYGFKAVTSGWYTLWQDVGIYYGVDSGLSFILGSDGFALVDQYALGSDGEAADPLWIGGRPVNLPRTAAADPLAPALTVPVTITSYASSAIIGLGRENLDGSATLTLIRPGGLEISPTNASAYGITVTQAISGIFYSMRDPLPGTWQAKVNNAAPDDHWHLLFFASKRMPQVDLLSPASPGEPWSPAVHYPIQWSVPPDLPPGVDVRVSLYYTVTNGGALTTTQEYGGMIVENLPIADGGYDWAMDHLASGTYYVYARVSNGGDDDYLPRPTISGTDQLPGVLQVQAPGSIALTDPSIPQVPQNLTLTGLNEALQACWDVVPDRDLAGYVVHYQAPDVDGFPQDHYLRQHGLVNYGIGARQCARIGGLNDGTVVNVQVSAYDASGNVSAYSGYAWGSVSKLDPDHGPAAGDTGGYPWLDHAAVITWTGVLTPGLAAGYLLYYAPDLPAGPGMPGSGALEGPSPVDVGDVQQYTLHGLEAGRMYHFAVRSYDDEGRLGPLTPGWYFWLSDGQDGNDDGLPDDWFQHYGLTLPGDDPDRDCLTNLQEYSLRTDPLRRDSDNDAFSDGEEFVAGSDPQDGHSLPEQMARLPYLWLSTAHLGFRAGTAGWNPPGQYVEIRNMGGGVLTPTVSTSSPWLMVDLTGNRLRVDVDKMGMTRGHYQGTITVGGAAGSCTQASPQTVTVDLWLFEGAFALNHHVYLPLLYRGSH